MELKLCQLIDCYIRNSFIKKGQAANVHQKLVRELILILINKPKQSLHTRNSFSNPFPFNCQDYEKEL